MSFLLQITGDIKMWSQQKSGTWGTAKCVPDVLTTTWHLLWSIIEQTHNNEESLTFVIKKKILSVMRLSGCLSFNRWRIGTNWNVCLIQLIITNDRNLKLIIYLLKGKQSCYLLNFVRVMLRFGNFSLNCSFRSFFSSEGFAYATMDTWKAYSLQENTLPFQFYDIWWNIGVVREGGGRYTPMKFLFLVTLCHKWGQ